ncbi:MAG: YtxH domain-containing protein [Candidatus Saccharimonadales bacterium]
MSKNTAGKVALGAVIAGAVGYVAGILTAPKSGKETRQDIKDTTKKSIAEVERQLKRLHTELDKALREAKDRAVDLKGRLREELDELIAKASQAKEKAREALSAAHEGQSDDKDLQKAIKDVESALKHLADFAKK